MLLLNGCIYPNVKREQFIQKLNAGLLGKLTFVAVLMFGFGYALIPIYKAICELTGVNILSAQEELIGNKALKVSS